MRLHCSNCGAKAQHATFIACIAHLNNEVRKVRRKNTALLKTIEELEEANKKMCERLMIGDFNHHRRNEESFQVRSALEERVRVQDAVRSA